MLAALCQLPILEKYGMGRKTLIVAMGSFVAGALLMQFASISWGGKRLKPEKPYDARQPSPAALLNHRRQGS